MMMQTDFMKRVIEPGEMDTILSGQTQCNVVSAID